MRAVGIDLGTTTICGVLLDTDSGAVLRSRTENSRAFIGGGAEWERIQSPERIVSLATEILEDLLCDEVVAIGVTGQMHGIVYTDRHGKAVSPLYTWQDGRGNLPYQDTTYAGYLNSHSGYGHVTDFYNRVNGLVPPQAVGYGTIHEYLVMQLCGFTKAMVHESDAAAFGCYDLVHKRWNYPYEADVITDYRVAGYYKGIPVGVAIGDNQAGVFSTLVNESDVLVNVGTGSQVSLISDHPVVGENVETRPYFDGKFLVVGSALCGGRAYSLLKDFYAAVLGYVTPLEEDAVYAVMEQLLAKAGTSSLTVDTRFAGTRSNAAQCGSIVGITTENFTPAHLTRGVLEGMAAELVGMYRQMGEKRSGLVGSGNGLRKNPTFIRILEESFGAPMKMPSHLEEAAVGAALFGLVACRVFQNADEAHKRIVYANR